MTTSLEEGFQSLSISQNGSTKGKGKSVNPLLDDIRELSRDVARALDQLYQIQEHRHTKAKSPRLQELLSEVNQIIPTLPSRLAAIHDKDDDDAQCKILLEDLHVELEDAISQHAALMVEMKDDERLSRFEGTAQQAAGMMDPLEASLTQCLHYVERVSSSPVPVPLTSDLPELPSYKHLQTLVDRHEQMKKAYSPSISRILKMLEKSITDRATQNGAMLRRFDEISRRWVELQRRIAQLEARVRIVMDHQNGGSEILHSPSTRMEYFTPDKSVSHRSSVSSGSTSSKPLPKPPPGIGVATLPTPTLRRQTSFMSATSSSTARTVERAPSATIQTPANKRVASVNRSNIPSPTPSSSSTMSKSRIPVSSPVPRLSVSNLGPRRSLGSQEVLQTPTRPGTNGAYSSMTVPRASLAPSLPRSMTAPRPRGPPSSFRTLTPTPSGRPSSRMSMVSYAPSGVAPANLQPFQPSKFDYLDMTVQRIIDEVGFNLFVARVDQAMKRGQTRREGEEWKGEFVFGAGQRTSSVKLLKLAGKASSDGPRLKCMARVQGAWQDLATVLRKRQAEAPESGSP